MIPEVDAPDGTALPTQQVLRHVGADVPAFGKLVADEYTQWRSLSSVTVANGPWSGAYTLQYIGAADDINAAPTDIGAKAPAVTYHSVQMKYAVSKQLDLSIGVDNLFDKKAPFIKSYTDANTDTMTYDLQGRRWHVRAGYRW